MTSADLDGLRMESTIGGTPRRNEWLAVGLIAGGALALRLVQLTHFELWVDEAATWWFARLTAGGQIAEQIALEPTPPGATRRADRCTRG